MSQNLAERYHPGARRMAIEAIIDFIDIVPGLATRRHRAAGGKSGRSPAVAIRAQRSSQSADLRFKSIATTRHSSSGSSKPSASAPWHIDDRPRARSKKHSVYRSRSRTAHSGADCARQQCRRSRGGTSNRHTTMAASRTIRVEPADAPSAQNPTRLSSAETFFPGAGEMRKHRRPTGALQVRAVIFLIAACGFVCRATRGPRTSIAAQARARARTSPRLGGRALMIVAQQMQQSMDQQSAHPSGRRDGIVAETGGAPCRPRSRRRPAPCLCQRGSLDGSGACSGAFLELGERQHVGRPILATKLAVERAHKASVVSDHDRELATPQTPTSAIRPARVGADALAYRPPVAGRASERDRQVLFRRGVMFPLSGKDWSRPSDGRLVGRMITACTRRWRTTSRSSK